MKVNPWWRTLGAFSMVAGVWLVSALSMPACGTDEGDLCPSGDRLDCTKLPGADCTNLVCVCPADKEDCCGGRTDPCERACHDPEDCVRDAGVGEEGGGGEASGSGGGNGASGSGGAGGTTGEGGSTPECVTPADCPGPADSRCGAATCIDGVCGLSLIAAPGHLVPVSSQIRGDCRTEVCDATGYSLTVQDAADLYNDNKQCTVDMCGADGAMNLTVADGLPCLGGAGWCFGGKCVECIDEMPDTQDCGPGNACDYIYCVPSICVANNMCGGNCAPCLTGYTCKVDKDCTNDVCSSFMCALPMCGDFHKNDGETDVDCGGPVCAKTCMDGQGCGVPTDCESGVCWAGICQVPTCTDGVKNGSEVDIDCGGLCAACVP